MNNLLVRLSHIFAQILFSIITPFLLIPWIAQLSITRLFVAFCFGRLYGNRYQKIIDSFQGRYSLPMAKGLYVFRGHNANGNHLKLLSIRTICNRLK